MCSVCFLVLFEWASWREWCVSSSSWCSNNYVYVHDRRVDEGNNDKRRSSDMHRHQYRQYTLMLHTRFVNCTMFHALILMFACMVFISFLLRTISYACCVTHIKKTPFKSHIENKFSYLLAHKHLKSDINTLTSTEQNRLASVSLTSTTAHHIDFCIFFPVRK